MRTVTDKVDETSRTLRGARKGIVAEATPDVTVPLRLRHVAAIPVVPALYAPWIGEPGASGPPRHRITASRLRVDAPIGTVWWMIRKLGILWLLGVSAAAGACSSGSGASTGSTDPPASDGTETPGVLAPGFAATLVSDGVRLWVRLPSDDGLDAPVEGTLLYDEDDECFLLERGGSAYPVVWPAGTTAESSGPTVVSSDGVRIAVGQYVVGGGGYLDIAEALGVPADCSAATEGVAVFNANSTLSIRP